MWPMRQVTAQPERLARSRGEPSARRRRQEAVLVLYVRPQIRLQGQPKVPRQHPPAGGDRITCVLMLEGHVL